MSKSIKNEDFYNGFLLLTFSIVLILMTPSQVPLYEGSDALSPRLIPYITLTLISVIGFIMMLSALLSGRKKISVQEDLDQEKENDGLKKLLEERNLKDLVIFILISLLIIVFAEFIGFTFASMIGLFAGLIAFGAKSKLNILAVSIFVPLVIEIGYRLMGIYLPLGFWENIIYSIF